MARRGYQEESDYIRRLYEAQHGRIHGSKIVQKFNTVGEYLDYVKGPSDMLYGRRASRKDSTRGFGYLDWYGGVDWDGALYLAEHGWREGIEQVEKFTNKLNTVLSGWIKQPEIRYADEGLTLDIGKLQAGEPEFMMNIVDSAIRLNARPPRIVRIVMNTCLSGSNGPDVLILRGAAVAALALMLEKHGVRAEIDLTAANRAGPGMETWVKIKKPEEALNMPYLVFLLAHPSSFRRLMFSCWERQPREVRNQFNIPGGYGYVGEVADANDRGDIYIPGLETPVGKSEAATLKWIQAQLQEQGIEVEHD